MLGSRRCETSARGVPVDLAKCAAPARVGEARAAEWGGARSALELGRRKGAYAHVQRLMSRNRISTATLDHELKSYPGAPGTICALTNTKIIGSDIAHAARIKIGVFMKMRGGMPYFRLPQAGNCWAHTKDFKVMPLSNGVCYRDYFNLPQTAPKVSLPLPDLGNQVEEQGARIERELQQLRSDPAAFKGRDVYQRWIEDQGAILHFVTRYLNFYLGGAIYVWLCLP